MPTSAKASHHARLLKSYCTMEEQVAGKKGKTCKGEKTSMVRSGIECTSAVSNAKTMKYYMPDY